MYELYSEAYTPWEWHSDLFAYAKAKEITLFSTPFDFTAIELLEKLGAPAYKIASFECIDLPLIREAAKTKKPLIISTGMADETEIAEAVEIALTHGSGELALLHCISGYPAPPSDYNLRTINHMRKRYGVEVGLSDHTLNNITATAAVSLGAVIVEKHVTLDRSGGGPDDSFSLEEKELKDLCVTTKTAWQSLGSINYGIADSEKPNIKFRRSLYFVKSLKAGDFISPDCIKSVRPGYGLPPKFYDLILGKRVLKDVNKYTAITTACVDIKTSST